MANFRSASGATPQRWKAQDEPSFTHFFDLPREVRDMIYIYWPKVAWIDIAQTHPRSARRDITDRGTDKSVAQPNISKVCRRMRVECLDVFYGKNKFLLDLRGWKHYDYPRRWTPRMIFEHWMDGIGDLNAARLRFVSFWSHNFAAHIKISSEPPRISLKFRISVDQPEPAEDVPVSYTMDVAARRAEFGLRSVLGQIEAARAGHALRADDMKEICHAVESLQPFLCVRNCLGYKGAILPSENRGEWPSTRAHLAKCDDCGYHRYMRGEMRLTYLHIGPLIVDEQLTPKCQQCRISVQL